MKETTVAVVGLGYVGLPLALAFGRTPLETYGFDISASRVDQLSKGTDHSGELPAEDFSSSNVHFTSDAADLTKANFFVVAVPTPVTKENEPDFHYLISVSELLGKYLKKGDTVVFESTVYPGATEEVCLPVLEKASGLSLGKDFALGYSPERTNPGDKEHTLETVMKIVSGHDAVTCDYIAEVYETVCRAGVHKATSIKTAEAAKIVENIQRDVNIALVNELSHIFDRLGIVTKDVIDAAGTKWNFAKYSPGLVGGHCIGVDPYYLIAKAKSTGYQPNLLETARQINDQMAHYIADQVAAALPATPAKILVVGLTFKENVRDTRNSRIAVTIEQLQAAGHQLFGYDPMLSSQEISGQFKVTPVEDLAGDYAAVIIATPHRHILTQKAELQKLASQATVVFDIKRVLPDLEGQETVRYHSL